MFGLVSNIVEQCLLGRLQAGGKKWMGFAQNLCIRASILWVSEGNGAIHGKPHQRLKGIALVHEQLGCYIDG